jgi:uncharacterized membrane protein YraQ (UPF0718 family)
MLGPLLFLLAFLIVLAALEQRRPRPAHGQVVVLAWDQLKPLAVRLPVALIAAGFLGELLPEQQVAGLLGPGSGLTGILLASFLGGLFPGGPSTAFPLMIVLAEAGAGTAQLIALLNAWSVIALHRVLIFEVPMMGISFSLRRLAASILLPLLTGLATAAAAAIAHRI